MYIAVDLGGTKTLVAAYTNDGHLVRSHKTPTEKEFDQFIAKLPSEIKVVAEGESIEAIAVAAPGVIDYTNKLVRAFGNLSWENVDIVGPLAHSITDQVLIENDANLGALGESHMGAGIGHDTVLYITLSTGIGTGITYKGMIANVLRQSEGGMMRFYHEGQYKLWEAFASGKAFVERYGQFGRDDDNPEHWQAWAKDVALGVHELMAMLQPDVIIIGGSMGEHIHKYRDYLRAEISQSRSQTVKMPSLVGAKYPDTAVINGGYIACKQLLQESA